MSMSPSEIGAIVAGLVIGFWLVNRMLGGNAGEKPDHTGSPDVASTGDRRSIEAADDARRPWWVVLEVPRISTREEIARAYRRKISDYHPDKVAQMGAEIRALAERRSKEIDAAHDEAIRSL